MCSILIKKKIRNLHNSLPLKTLLLIKKPQQEVWFSIPQNPSFFLPKLFFIPLDHAKEMSLKMGSFSLKLNTIEFPR